MGTMLRILSTRSPSFLHAGLVPRLALRARRSPCWAEGRLMPHGLLRSRPLDRFFFFLSGPPPLGGPGCRRDRLNSWHRAVDAIMSMLGSFRPFPLGPFRRMSCTAQLRTQHAIAFI